MLVLSVGEGKENFDISVLISVLFFWFRSRFIHEHVVFRILYRCVRMHVR